MSVDFIKALESLGSTTLGVILGFLATRYIDSQRERLVFRQALNHIRSEISNAERHYLYSRNENLGISSSIDWFREIQLNKCRFYGSGFGSFNPDTLRLFPKKVSQNILDYFLVVRNNEFYIDQAIKYTSVEGPIFAEVIAQLFDRFDMTISQGAHLEHQLQQRYGDRFSGYASDRRIWSSIKHLLKLFTAAASE